MAKDSVLKALIHYNSQANLARGFTEVYNGKSRNIGLRHSFMRNLIKDEIISLSYIPSSYNVVVMFTKPLARDLMKTTSRGTLLQIIYFMRKLSPHPTKN